MYIPGRVRSLSEVSYHSVRVKRQTAHLVPFLLSMPGKDSIAPVRIKLSLNIASRSAMKNIVWVILFVAFAHAQYVYKLCAPTDIITNATCYILQRGNSEVTCVRVADSAECAIRLASGEADFGIFTAEESLLAHEFYPSIKPIFQLRHKEKMGAEFKFDTVAVISADLSQKSLLPGERLQLLRNNGFCHPGFSKSQWWNDYILKYFERKINPLQCQENMTIIENEIRSLRDFFGKACRPGEWAADPSIDRELKMKYQDLCALCDNPINCSYKNDKNHGHFGALECLIHGYGKVAYVALDYVREHLKRNDTFQFLCKNGDVLPLSTDNPCTWIRQPWDVIVARKEIAEAMPFRTKLLEWLKPPLLEWQNVLNNIIQEDSLIINITETTSMHMYLSEGRDMEFTTTESCNRTIRWCTIGDMETNKCKWVARAAMALGVAPKISCIKSNSTFQCFRDIAENRADIIAIDSNYGYLTRTVYSLSTVLYSETEMDKNNMIIAVVPEPTDNNYPVKSFRDLNNRKVCFPEYGGIGWLSFVNVTRMHGIISNSCDYSLLISELLSGACTPGIMDADHSRIIASTDISKKLCSACLHQNNTSCAVNETNHYYSDKGAMRCIREGAGDVAIVEAGSIIDNTIDPNMYRILCKNGSLARNPGFNFDEICALSVTIDSEIVSRRNDLLISKTDIMLALLKIEDWLGYRVNVQRPIHIYGPFNRTLDLLFKDSSSGLVSTSSTKKSILAYKELFSHVEKCLNSSLIVTANFIFIILIALYHLFPGY